MTEHYTVADFSFAVTLLEERDLDMLLLSFRSFRSKAPAEGVTIAPSLAKAEKDITTINKDNAINRFIENCF